MPDMPLNILLIDDDPADRNDLSGMLAAFGHNLVAVDGASAAMATFTTHVVHLVLLKSTFLFRADEGVVSILHNAAKDMGIPVVFLADSDIASLAPCLKQGGADFFVKPYNADYIYNKLDSLTRIIDEQKSFDSQRKAVKNCGERLSQHYSIRELFDQSIVHLNCLDTPSIQSFSQSKQPFNRCIMLAANKPDGGKHLLLGEFNAHRLEAALSAFPLADIFFSLTEKGFLMRQILVELNRRLSSILPVDIVFNGAFIDVKVNEESLEIWNAEAPNVYVYSQGEAEPIVCSSQNQPLGIASRWAQDYHVDLVPYKSGDQLMMFSNGVCRLQEGSGGVSYQALLNKMLSSVTPSKNKLDWLKENLNKQGLLDASHEDVSCLTMTLNTDLVLPKAYEKKIVVQEDRPADFSLDYVLNATTLKNTDPLPYILQILTTVPGLNNSSAQVFMILSELYSNALEHGVLKLSSVTKSCPDGFAKYYESRQTALDELDDGFVKIHIKVKADIQKALLVLRVEDSGDGFDFSRLTYQVDNTEMLYNRGFALVDQLCEKLEFSHDGRVVTAYYDWQRGAFS
ncbi:SpoIIE family protein phosphatase [Marinomonas sp.]